jgi:ElaA protein
MNLRWKDREFAELSVAQLYKIIALRQRVFVVEQKCLYLDADGHDANARHLWAEDDAGVVHAYLRILPAGAKYAEASIGRVVTSPESRGTGLGRVLMQRGIEAVGPAPIKISAQAHLEKFYTSLGFVTCSAVYDDDGIPHVDMLRAP